MDESARRRRRRRDGGFGARSPAKPAFVGANSRRGRRSRGSRRRRSQRRRQRVDASRVRRKDPLRKVVLARGSTLTFREPRTRWRWSPLCGARGAPRRVPVLRSRTPTGAGVRGGHPERLFVAPRRPRRARRRSPARDRAARTGRASPRWRTRCSCPRRSTRSSPSCARRCAPPWRRWRRGRERRQG